MSWYAIGAAIIVFMLTVNIVVFLLRRRARRRTAPLTGRQLSADELATYAAMVTVWIVGFALPYVRPETTWGKALAQPWALPSLVAWSMLVGLVLLFLMRVNRARRSAGNA